MTTEEPRPQPTEGGYRGALPPKDDTLARPWVLLVIAIFVLILVLSALGIPSRFTAEETPTPSPSATVEASEPAEPTESAEPSEAAEPSEPASQEPTESAEPSESAEASG